MSMRRLLVSLLLYFPIVVYGQHPVAVSFTLFNESTAIPFTRFLTTPIHPGIQIGGEMAYRHTLKTKLFQTANLSYFYHRYLAQGIAVSSEFGYEYRLKGGLAFAGRLGLGYLHTFATAEEFTHENGHYTSQPDKGNARLYPSLALDIGFYLRKSELLSPKIFLRYQPWIEYPYSPDFIPVMTHINLHVGALFFLHQKGPMHE